MPGQRYVSALLILRTWASRWWAGVAHVGRCSDPRKRPKRDLATFGTSVEDLDDEEP